MTPHTLAHALKEAEQRYLKALHSESADYVSARFELRLIEQRAIRFLFFDSHVFDRDSLGR